MPKRCQERTAVARTDDGRVIGLSSINSASGRPRGTQAHLEGGGRWTVTALFVAVALACDAKEAQRDALDNGQILGSTQGALELGLALGATGESVNELQDYLARYGYLANASLSLRYPEWRPVTGADQPGTFGPATESALRAMQRRAGARASGGVDAATFDLLRAPRCAVPEGVADYDRGGAFSLEGSSWSKTSLTWRVLNAPPSLSRELVTAALSAAFAKWRSETNLGLELVTEGADLEIRFAPIDGPGRSFADASFPSAGGDIILDEAEVWSIADQTTGGLDLESVALHEIGHALGLAHASVAAAIMYPYYAGQPRRELHASDRAAVSMLYDTWQEMLSGGAIDIGVGANDDAWIVQSPADAPNMGRVFRWNGSAWISVPGLTGASRIAVAPDGGAWVCDQSGAIFTHAASDSAAWISRPGCAVDVAVGSDGSVWGAGCPQPSDGSASILKWVSPAWQDAGRLDGARRIAVGPDGAPWVIANAGAMYRRTSADAALGEWRLVPGGALDLSLGPDGIPWAIGTIATMLGYKLYVRNEDASSDPSAPSGQWLPVVGGATNISSGRAGPWAVNSIGAVYRQSSLKASYQ